MQISREPIDSALRNQLINYVYDIVGCIHIVHQDLGSGMPEYVYQEALYKCLMSRGFVVVKEYAHHPLFMGKPLDAYIKMDLLVQNPQGNIIIEAKAISKLTDKEVYQTFGYLRGTGFPIAILVNFGSYPRAEIHRYYYKDGVAKAF